MLNLAEGSLPWCWKLLTNLKTWSLTVVTMDHIIHSSVAQREGIYTRMNFKRHQKVYDFFPILLVILNLKSCFIPFRMKRTIPSCSFLFVNFLPSVKKKAGNGTQYFPLFTTIGFPKKNHKVLGIFLIKIQLNIEGFFNFKKSFGSAYWKQAHLKKTQGQFSNTFLTSHSWMTSAGARPFALGFPLLTLLELYW